MFHVSHFFLETGTNKWSEIEVESRDCLTSVHLVLSCFHRDTCQHTCRLNALGRARCPVSSCEAVHEDVVERMLHASERLGRVVVLVVNVEVVVEHCIATFLTQQIVVNEWLGRFARELHHHACWRVCVHVRILASHIVVLDVDDFEEDVAGFRLASDTALVAIGDVALSHVLARTLHQLQFHEVLNLLNCHLCVAMIGDMVCDALDELFVFALIGVHHRLADGSHNFLLVEADGTTVALDYCLYHTI